jgi:hypothetical protein
MILFLYHGPFHPLYLHDLCPLSHHVRLFVRLGLYSYFVDLVVDP